MAAPTWQATGALATGTGGISCSWPAHVSGDIGLLFACMGTTAPGVLSTASGFSRIAMTAQAGLSYGAIWWCRATSSSMAAPVIADSGDGNAGLIMTFRDCIPTGNPWDVNAATNQASTSSASIASLTSTLSDLLLVTLTVASHAVNDTNPLIGANAVTNNACSNVTVQYDQASGLNNNGECISIISSNPTNIGTTGPTTWTLNIAARALGHVAVALKSSTSTNVVNNGNFFNFMERI